MQHFTIQPDCLYRASAPSQTIPTLSTVQPEPFDALVIAAHPDDAELSCGGTIAQLTSEGKRVAIVECTRGEMGTRGTPELRRMEAAEAARILSLEERWNLDIPDGNIGITPETIARIIAAIRWFRPTLLLFPPPFERHLDHENVHRLVRTAVFQSGLGKMVITIGGTNLPTFRPKRLLSYMQTYDFEPSFYVDITAHYETKLQSFYAHASQVFVPGRVQAGGESEAQTFISSPEFLEFLNARARHFGGKVGVKYAEAFLSIEPLGFASMGLLM
jgi:N-acetylglucosamine malate deacetylase 1